MKILVTGGVGFIGSHLCEALIQDGNEVMALDDLSTGNRSNLWSLNGGPRFVSIEVSMDGPKIEHLISRCHSLKHLVSTVKVQKVFKIRLGLLPKNLEGLENKPNGAFKKLDCITVDAKLELKTS